MENQDVDNSEMHSQAEMLSDLFSSYALARMYIQKCMEVDKAMEENRHLQSEIEKWKYTLEECEMENEEYRRQLSTMRGF